MREIKFRAWLDDEMYKFDLINGGSENLEVIGNIYENPELIKEQ